MISNYHVGFDHCILNVLGPDLSICYVDEGMRHLLNLQAKAHYRELKEGRGNVHLEDGCNILRMRGLIT